MTKQSSAGLSLLVLAAFLAAPLAAQEKVLSVEAVPSSPVRSLGSAVILAPPLTAVAPLSAPSLAAPALAPARSLAPAPASLSAAALPAPAIPSAAPAAAVSALDAASPPPSRDAGKADATKEDEPQDPGRAMFDQASPLSPAEDDLERRRIQRLGHAQAADPDLLIARMDGESKGTALPLGQTGRAQQGRTPTCAACGLTNACGLPDSAAESINALLRHGDPDRPVRGGDLMRLASGPPFNGRAVTRDEISEVVAKLRKPVVVVLDFGGKTAHVVVVDGYFQARGRTYVSINDSQVGYRLFMTAEQFQRLAPNPGEGPRGGLYFPEKVDAAALTAVAAEPSPLRPAWTADSARAIDWTQVDLGKTESIHARVGTYGGYVITELRLPDGSKVMKIEPKDPASSTLRADLTKRLRIERKLTELGIAHNKALAYFAGNGHEALIVEMQTAEEGGAHPVKSLFAQDEARFLSAVKEYYGKLRQAGLMPDDLGEALLLDHAGKLVLGQLFNVREKGTPEYDAARRKAEAFIANAAFVDGGVSRPHDLSDLKREVSVFQDLSSGRAPRDREAFSVLARYNNVEPGDPLAPKIVEKFLSNRIPHMAETLGVRPSLPDGLRAKPFFKTLYVGISDVIMGKMKFEYDDAVQRFNLPGRPYESPFEKGTLVEVFIFKEPSFVVRAYTKGKSNPQGYWVFTREQVIGPDGRYKTGPELQRDLALPEQPDRLAVLEIPAGTVGYRAVGASAFGQEGGKPQLYLRTYKENYRVADDLPLASGAQ
ncbi:MAG: hypothetical protein ACHQ2Z_12805 [Elusimicrobiota bacterium]